MATRRHVCTGQCWSYLIRNGEDENTTECDPFDASAASEQEAILEGAIW